MADPAALSSPAPAKINLYLHVTGKRPDGFHELDSLVAFAGINDVVEVSPADELSLTVDGPFAEGLTAGSDNLALKAAEKLRETAGIGTGAAIRLEKRLPVASGIGGGSADAAAALNGLMALWQIDPASLDLGGVAMDLGADVPVCLHGRAAFVGGIGDEIERAPALPPAWLVLVNPGQPLSTSEVFGEHQGDFSGPGRFDESPATTDVLAGFLADRGNDLTEAAERLLPAVTQVLKSLEAEEDCLLARMSGSGATCFGLFADAGGAARAAAELGQQQTEWWVRAAPLLDDTRSLRG